jgi:hypothetical protein
MDKIKIATITITFLLLFILLLSVFSCSANGLYEQEHFKNENQTQSFEKRKYINRPENYQNVNELDNLNDDYKPYNFPTNYQNEFPEKPYEEIDVSKSEPSSFLPNSHHSIIDKQQNYKKKPDSSSDTCRNEIFLQQNQKYYQTNLVSTKPNNRTKIDIILDSNGERNYVEYYILCGDYDPTTNKFEKKTAHKDWTFNTMNKKQALTTPFNKTKVTFEKNFNIFRRNNNVCYDNRGNQLDLILKRKIHKIKQNPTTMKYEISRDPVDVQINYYLLRDKNGKTCFKFEENNAEISFVDNIKLKQSSTNSNILSFL